MIDQPPSSFEPNNGQSVVSKAEKLLDYRTRNMLSVIGGLLCLRHNLGKTIVRPKLSVTKLSIT